MAEETIKANNKKKKLGVFILAVVIVIGGATLFSTSDIKRHI